MDNPPRLAMSLGYLKEVRAKGRIVVHYAYNIIRRG
jgi:hypothetical protein